MNTPVRSRSDLPAPLPEIRLLDTRVTPCTVPEFLGYVAECVDGRKRRLVTNHNLHSLALTRSDECMRDLIDSSDLVFIDGFGALAISQALGHRVHADMKVSVLDWIWPLLRTATERNWTIMHLGSDTEVIREALAQIDSNVPKAHFIALPGYFDKDPRSRDTARVIRQIRRVRPDVLLIGFGMPVQEHWLSAVWSDLPDCVCVTVGGVIGYLGNERKTPPRWLGRYGFEWLYRLIDEPSRLCHRYLVEPWCLVKPVAREMVLTRRTPR